MENQEEVIVEHKGKQYGATYIIERGMLQLKTHTETRSVELGDRDPGALARLILTEIVEGQSANEQV